MKKIALALAAVLVGLLIVIVGLGAARPAHYEVSRSRVVNATPEQLAPMLTDLRAWNTWNPWDVMEPTATKEYSEPASGVGAWYTWRGEQTGSGRMEIISISPTRVDYALHFTAPMEDSATVHFVLASQGTHQTQVTWSMEGEQNLMGRIFGLFMDMDTMIGADFEQGLRNLDDHFRAPS